MAAGPVRGQPLTPRQPVMRWLRHCGGREVGQETVSELRGLLERQLDFQISSQRVDLYGWCAGCGSQRQTASE